MKQATRYPRENVCRRCRAHIGWILHPNGELVSLDLCESCAHAARARRRDHRERPRGS